MMSLQDTLYNWLTIKVVVDERPFDTAAAETEQMFSDMLKLEHQVEGIDIQTDAVMYYLHYRQNGENKTSKYPRELIEIMLKQISEAPDRYQNYE